jgi:hypothetical protein
MKKALSLMNCLIITDIKKQLLFENWGVVVNQWKSDEKISEKSKDPRFTPLHSGNINILNITYEHT